MGCDGHSLMVVIVIVSVEMMDTGFTYQMAFSEDGG